VRVDSYPRVVVCDRDIALMNAIRILFLELIICSVDFTSIKCESKM